MEEKEDTIGYGEGHVLYSIRAHLDPGSAV